MLFQYCSRLARKGLMGKRIFVQKMVRNKNKRKTNNNEERMCSDKSPHSLFTPMDRTGSDRTGKVSLCTFMRKLKKASLTVEAALVLPLFLFGSVTMISFMDMYKLQTEHLTRLCEEAKVAAMYAYVLDGRGVEDITLPDIYSYKPIGGWISLPRIWMINTVKVHAWTGKDYGGSGDSESDEEEDTAKVYVTETGSVYHVDENCTYLKLSITQVSGSAVGGMTNNYGRHYDACEICSHYQSPASTVFITDTGTAYHNQATCSGLKRTVHAVSEAEVEGMRVCSRCGNH